jgi:hypothetical protein
MQCRRFRIAAALAALSAVPPSVFAQSQSEALQSPRRDPWALVAERALWDAEQPQALRASPGFSGVSDAGPGWLRSAEFKPAVQLDLAQGWALCADWDRVRPKAVQLRESIDTFLLGLQLRFR